MKALDAYLRRHDVDVGQSVGLLLFAAAAWSFYGMVGHWFSGRFTVPVLVPLWVLLGIAAWRHADWARGALLIGAWLTIAALIAMTVALPFTGTARLAQSLTGPAITHASLWQAYVLILLIAPVPGFALAVLHSEKAKAEFAVATRRRSDTGSRRR